MSTGKGMSNLSTTEQHARRFQALGAFEAPTSTVAVTPEVLAAAGLMGAPASSAFRTPAGRLPGGGLATPRPSSAGMLIPIGGTSDATPRDLRFAFSVASAIAPNTGLVGSAGAGFGPTPEQWRGSLLSPPPSSLGAGASGLLPPPPPPGPPPAETDDSLLADRLQGRGSDLPDLPEGDGTSMGGGVSPSQQPPAQGGTLPRRLPLRLLLSRRLSMPRFLRRSFGLAVPARKSASSLSRPSSRFSPPSRPGSVTLWCLSF